MAAGNAAAASVATYDSATMTGLLSTSAPVARKASLAIATGGTAVRLAPGALSV